MWDYVITLGGIVVATAGVVIGYITFHEKKKQRRIAEYEKRKEERERLLSEKTKLEVNSMFMEFRDLIREDINYFIETHIDKHHNNLISIEESKRGDQRLWDKLEKIEADLQQHFNESVESEASRLATEIINYGEELKLGMKKTEVSYKHISHCYDRYKRLGGNYYIDSVYAYIKKVMDKAYDEED